MSSEKLVSVGVPVYNESARIADCIECIQKQTYPNIEICISDNASSDGTYDLARRLAEENDNIRVIRQERNLGVMGNFNAVRRMASGEYFMWHAADDTMYPTHIEKMVAQLEAFPHAVASQSARCWVDDHGSVVHEVRYRGSLNPNNNGPLRQVMNIMSPLPHMRSQKFSQLVGELYRKGIVDGILNRPDNNVLEGGQRIFMMLAVLSSGGLRYVDEILYEKHSHSRSFDKRNPGDPFNEDKRRRRKTIIREVIRAVWVCPTIPLHRRWYGLIVAFPFILTALESGGRVPRPIRQAMTSLRTGLWRQSQSEDSM